jgi:hypothetical protein
MGSRLAHFVFSSGRNPLYLWDLREGNSSKEVASYEGTEGWIRAI